MIQKKDWKIGTVYNYGREVEKLNTDDHDYEEINMDDPVFMGRGFVTVTDGKIRLSFVNYNWDSWNGVGMKLIFKR